MFIPMSRSGTKGELCQPTDEELARRLAEGEQDGSTAIIERYQRTVLRIMRRILRHDAEAEDAAQEVFLEIFCDISKFDPRRGEFAAWVKKLAQRRALDQRRYLSRRGFYSSASLEESVFVQRSNRVAAEVSRWTQELLATLERKEREFLELKYIEGLTAREIAEMTGDSPSTVYHTLFAARRKLQSLVNGRE
jgi:RNA polymerase sigma-70 factor (ECF subfamily)